MQRSMPSFIDGIHFQRLSLGAVPFSILGVRHNPALNSDHLGIGALLKHFLCTVAAHRTGQGVLGSR